MYTFWTLFKDLELQFFIFCQGKSVMLIYFKPRRSHVTQDCYEFISISFLTVCVVIRILVPVYSLCIKGLFLNWSLFRVEEHNTGLSC